MTYRNFTLPDVIARFGLDFETTIHRFAAVSPVTVDPSLTALLDRHAALAVASNEKGRSEWLVSPVLGHVWWLSRNQLNLHSGVTFDVDA